jgi:hypothetical protein
MAILKESTAIVKEMPGGGSDETAKFKTGK